MSRTLGAYVHVPFCATRCGYCDFNTYTAAELHRDGTTVSVATYADRVVSQIRQGHVDRPDDRVLSTVFFGGGTPTLMPASELVRMLAALRDEYGLEDGAEVTTEANPDSVTLDYLRELRDGGFTRMSFGHQSSAPHVLQLLERTHTPGRTWEAVAWAREAGFDHVSVDLIYGSQVESDDDLRMTLADAVAADIDHISAYSLIVESGTRMAAKVERGEVPAASDDVAAHRYPIIDEQLKANGFEWYEVSNWAKRGGECQHNIAYWSNQDWLGIGPGAHAHDNGVRMWNVKHPAAWAAAVDSGSSPWADSEVLTIDEQRREHIMLRLRLREGLPISFLSEKAWTQAVQAVIDGLLEQVDDRLVLTDRGRLLADGLVARLWD